MMAWLALRIVADCGLPARALGCAWPGRKLAVGEIQGYAARTGHAPWAHQRHENAGRIQERQIKKKRERRNQSRPKHRLRKSGTAIVTASIASAGSDGESASGAAAAVARAVVVQRSRRTRGHGRATSPTLHRIDEMMRNRDQLDINYSDAYGRKLSSKEAFRQLCHQFHGIVPGRAKTEKDLKKMEEDKKLSLMHLTDTPLNAVAASQSAREKTGKAFINLDAKKVSEKELKKS
jgi:hypothetical protein